MTVPSGRLLLRSSHVAAVNMSIDQAILDSVGTGGPPTLRFYQWDRPSLSIGYFQKYADRYDHRPSAISDCVRRSTGGGAILHHHDLTYSLAVPVPRRDTGGRQQLYRDVHACIARALGRFGIPAKRYADSPGRLNSPQDFLCFRRRSDDDLVCRGYKILGSAQRRSQTAVLQHGSLLIRSSEFAPELPGLMDLVGVAWDVDEFVAMLAEDLQSVLQMSWREGLVTTDESEAADAIQRKSFGSSRWLKRR